MSYVLYFSKPFALAIAIWPFLSLLLTLPVLALLYHRDNRLRFTSALTAYLVVLYLIALACFTMYPMPENPATYCAAHHLRPQLNPFEFIHDIRTDGITGVMQLAMNVVFFLPLGYFMKRVFRWKFATALPAMFLTSLLIETTQLTGIWGIYPCAYRLFDVDDLITNTLGGILGYAMGSIVTHFLPQQRIDEDAITTEPGFVRRCVALAIDLFLVETASLSVTALIYLVGVLFDVNRANNVNAAVSAVATIVMFVLFEGIIPWRRAGRTLGGGFTRMTVETRERSGMRRIVFYTLRALVLYCAVYGLWTDRGFYALLFGMPGIPCIYYGSEWGAEGNKQQGDDALRPSFDAPEWTALTDTIAAMAKAHRESRALCYGDFRQLVLTNRQCIWERCADGERVLIAVNIDDQPYTAHFDAKCGRAVDLITGEPHDFGGGSELPPYSVRYWRCEA